MSGRSKAFSEFSKIRLYSLIQF